MTKQYYRKYDNMEGYEVENMSKRFDGTMTKQYYRKPDIMEGYEVDEFTDDDHSKIMDYYINDDRIDGASMVSSLSGVGAYANSSASSYSDGSFLPSSRRDGYDGGSEAQTYSYANSTTRATEGWKEKQMYVDDSTATTAHKPFNNDDYVSETDSYSYASTARISVTSEEGKPMHRDYKVSTTVHADASTSSPSTSSRMKFESLRQYARTLARVGQNVRVKNNFRLPVGVDKSDICVQVQIDPRARASWIESSLKYMSGNWRFEERIKTAIQDELEMIYSCALDNNPKYLLEVVIVALTDGSLLRTMRDKEGVVGLAEIACVWQLHMTDHPDDEYFEGGLSVEYEDVGYDLTDIFLHNGEYCLLKKLAPRLANRIVSRIGECGDDLMADF